MNIIVLNDLPDKRRRPDSFLQEQEINDNQFSAPKHQPGSEYTQISGTRSTYGKVINKLFSLKSDIRSILDYGAGKGLGTKEMQDIVFNKLHKDVSIESLELYPIKWKPDYTNSSQITKRFDAIVCIYVLNVLVKDIRNDVVSDVIRLLNSGGLAVFIVRSVGSVASIKSGSRGEESASYYHYVGKDKSVQVYQKGFTRRELVEYLDSFDGISLIDNAKSGGLGNVCVIIKKN